MNSFFNFHGSSTGILVMQNLGKGHFGATQTFHWTRPSTREGDGVWSHITLDTMGNLTIWARLKTMGYKLKHEESSDRNE